MDPVFWTECVDKEYAGRRILISASIRLAPGAIVGLLGRMGSGKSTLLRICAGLLFADRGMLFMRGERVRSPDYAVLARQGLAFVPAHGGIVQALTVRAHFREVARRYGVNHADEIVHTLALEPLMPVRGGALSGGERKRVGIALALAREPAVLLLDETFRDLDPLVTETISAALRRQAARGCAIVVAGHEVESLFACVDTVAWLVEGRIESLGSPAAAVAHERFAAEYLGGRLARERGLSH